MVSAFVNLNHHKVVVEVLDLFFRDGRNWCRVVSEDGIEIECPTDHVLLEEK